MNTAVPPAAAPTSGQSAAGPDHTPVGTGGRVLLSGAKGVGKVAIVDDADLAAFALFRWSLGSDGYARRKATESEKASGAPTNIAMHRQVLGIHLTRGVPGVAEVDHINRDRLDNRRENLRVVGRRLNSINRAGSGKYSQYIGVSFFKPAKLWRAYMQRDGKRVELGYFKSEVAAAQARDAAIIATHGNDPSLLNFPEAAL